MFELCQFYKSYMKIKINYIHSDISYMYLITYGTRPELIKLFPLINKMRELGVIHKTLFTGQHKDLISEFENLTHVPDFVLKDVMVRGQSINNLISRIIKQSHEIVNDLDCKIIV